LWWFRFGEVTVHHTEEYVYKIHILPESEYNKIIAKKKEILDIITGRYLSQIIDELKNRVNASIDKKQLVENEITRVEKILKDESYKGSLVPSVHTGYSPFHLYLGFHKYEFLNLFELKSNQIAKWHNIFVEGGNFNLIQSVGFNWLERSQNMLDNPENWWQQKEQIEPILMAWIFFKYVEALKKMDLSTFSNGLTMNLTKMPPRMLDSST